MRRVVLSHRAVGEEPPEPDDWDLAKRAIACNSPAVDETVRIHIDGRRRRHSPEVHRRYCREVLA